MFSQRVSILSRALPYLFGLAAVPSLGGCIGTVGTGENPAACIPGERDCVCDSAQRCQAGLTCIADRCIALLVTSTPRTPVGTSTATPQQPSDDSPRAGETTNEPQPESSSTPEPTTSVPEPEPEPDPEQAACKDQQRNFRETDIDCGGPVCPACSLKKACRANQDCSSELCIGGQCAQCAEDADCKQENSCIQSRCDDRVCVDQKKKDGSRCDDNNPCTAKDRCRAGQCKGKDTLVLSENFDRGGKGWRLVTDSTSHASQWQVGKASTSSCGDQSAGQDPAQDHTQKGDNGVAGVKLGGCHALAPNNSWDCLWSKDVDVSFFDKPVVFSFWRHLHSPGGDLPSRTGVVSRIVYRVNKDQENSQALETGYAGTVNDTDWLYRPYKVNPGGAKSIAFGICYKKYTRSQSFAGWNIDDAKIRQEGCLVKDTK